MICASLSSSNQVDNGSELRVETEVEMTETQNEQDIKQALQQLGDNLKLLGQQAWDSPERRQLQAELESLVHQAEAALNEASNEFQQSGTRERLEQDLQRIRSNIETGEMGQRMRSELVQLLTKLNSELEDWLGAGNEKPDEATAEPGGNG